MLQAVKGQRIKDISSTGFYRGQWVSGLKENGWKKIDIINGIYKGLLLLNLLYKALSISLLWYVL
jgi:hypothetical protein